MPTLPQLVQTDLTGGAPDMVSEYEYLGDAGWKMTEPDGITDDKYRTRSDWRGYGKVRVTNSGDTVSPANTRTEHTFLRGLGGQVTDSTGTEHADSNELSGQELETATYNGAFTADKIVSKNINTTWSRTTATRVNSWGTDRAYFVRPETTTSYTALESGGWQETKSTTRYDAATGRATEVDDFGATGDPSDNRCVRTQYADNTAKHMLSFVSRVEQVAVACGTTPDRRTQVISDDLTYYDGLGLGAAPVKGDTTKVQRLASHDGTQAIYETLTSSAVADFDAFGRPLKVTDAAGKSTTIAYAETDGLTTKKTETNPLGWKTSTEYDRSWGSPAAQVDMNEKRTDLGYDALGRLTSVWLPDRPKASDFPPDWSRGSVPTLHFRAETAHYLVLTSGETLRITGRRVSVRRPASTSTFRKSTCLAGHRARSGLSCRFGTQGTPDGLSYQGCLRRRTDRSSSSSASAACPGVMSRSHSDAGPCGPADPVVLTSGTTGIQTSQPGISAHCSKWRHGTCGPGLDESCEPRLTLLTHASSGEQLTTLSPQNICTGGTGVSKSEAARRRPARRALSDYPSPSSWQAAR
ncbi:hypothetical protein ACFRR7_16445 [Streptomyces sp. NPDC056909]|uniref:hypothetical protein n=1 Tax=Streptomyces sp. NPDC056909 TaxID=3345963 RepID=UPI00367C4D40